MKNYGWCAYTYRHRKAFRYLVEKYIVEPEMREEMLRRAQDHDMDKMLMYLYMDQLAAQITHVKTQPHHLENQLPHTYTDLVETVLDYESAPYTKQDKPLNAYDFTWKLKILGHLSDEQAEELIEIMRTLGIAHSLSVAQDTEGKAYMAQFEDVSEEMILEEIREYLERYPEKRVPEINGIV